jgi:hypothetical protein
VPSKEGRKSNLIFTSPVYVKITTVYGVLQTQQCMAYYTQYQPETRTIPTIFPSSSVGAHSSLPMAFSVERYSTPHNLLLDCFIHSCVLFHRAFGYRDYKRRLVFSF